MIRDALIPMLRQRFSNEKLMVGVPPGPIVIFLAKHPSVGALEICDDGDEATIYIGEITHGHFNPYNEELSQEEVEKQVTEDVIDFLEDLFADRILLWKSKTRGSGGWQHLNYAEQPIEVDRDSEYYVWSGPYIPEVARPH